MFGKKKKDEDFPEKTGLREKFANALDMSKEVILDVPKVMLIGNREMTIENYKGIVEYTDTLIRLSAQPNNIKITGKKLEIKNVTQEMLYITGYISTFEYVK